MHDEGVGRTKQTQTSRVVQNPQPRGSLSRCLKSWKCITIVSKGWVHRVHRSNVVEPKISSETISKFTEQQRDTTKNKSSITIISIHWGYFTCKLQQVRRPGVPHIGVVAGTLCECQGTRWWLSGWLKLGGGDQEMV